MGTISPVSSSSYRMRQHSPQPSHRLSHSCAFIWCSRLVSQKGAVFACGGALMRLTSNQPGLCIAAMVSSPFPPPPRADVMHRARGVESAGACSSSASPP